MNIVIKLITGFLAISVSMAAQSQQQINPSLKAASGGIKRGNPDILNAFVQAESAYQAKDFGDARARFQTLVQEFPDEAGAWLRLGLIEQRDNDIVESLKAYDKVIALAKAKPEAVETQEFASKARFNRAYLYLQAAKQDFEQSGAFLDSSMLQRARQMPDQIVQLLDTDQDATKPALVSQEAQIKGNTVQCPTVETGVESDQRLAPIAEKGLVTKVKPKPVTTTSKAVIPVSTAVEVFEGGKVKK
jgi:tetratricopeptide (TPR) repeat protein